VNFLGGAVTFILTVGTGLLGVHALWDRYVPAHCPQCRGRMTIKYGPGRQITYACPLCGYRR
jgi:hypothetical protein